MKTGTIICLLLLIICAPLSARLNLPAAKEMTLDNGLTVKIIEKSNLPLFSIRMVFKAGSMRDPLGQEGLANICNEMLTRGTRKRTAKQLAEEIAFGGGTLTNFCDREMSGFIGEFLSEHGESGIAVLADMIKNSVLADEEITKIRNRTIAGLESQREDPSTVATVIFYNALLGNNRFAHQTDGTIESVERLERSDILEFIRQHYTPDNCLLVFCGDVDYETVKGWINRYFGDWRGTATLDDIDNEFEGATGREILIIDKEDATQTQIRIGNIGIPIDHADYIPLSLARSIYAGPFTSRLMEEIRTDRGLTYSVYLRVATYAAGGVNYINTYTKNESVGEVLDIILQEASRMYTEPVPDSEITGAVNYRIGLYPLNFETNDDLAKTFARLWFYDLDKSFYQDYQERIREVTPEQLMQMAGKYFPRDNYRLVLVGKAEEIKEQAAKFGKISIRSIIEDKSL